MSFVSRSASIRISRALGRLNALSIKQSRSLSTVLRFQSPSQRAALISLGLDPDEGRASPRSQEQLPSDEFEHQQWQPRRQPSETLMRSARHSFDPPAKISNIHSYYHREPQLVMIEELGIVQGEMDSSRLLTKYLNIPFGLVQDRLNPAVAPEPWKGIRDATVMGPMCPQSIEDTNNLRTTMLGLPGPGFEFSERDCLNLNVFAPRCVDNIPVICYIHGGGLEHGGNALPKNDATNIVKRSIAINKPVMVVTINFRLGPLGFTPHKNLLESGNSPSHENSDEGEIDWGLHDQKLALEWIRRNIHHFRGNPNEITLMGHSNGSATPGYHLLYSTSSSDSSHGGDLFKRAIMHSEPGPSSSFSSTKKEEETPVSLATEEKSMAILKSQQEGEHTLAAWGSFNSEYLEETQFTFMADACLPHMSEQQKEAGFRTIDRWVDFAWGQDPGETTVEN